MITIEWLNQVIHIAREAGEAILRVYENEQAVNVTDKADQSPLTEADLASHQIILAQLKKMTPQIPVLSEESASVPFAQRAAWAQYWLVDPLDGTKEFIKRNGEFTVNIALIEKGVPVLGVVYVPVTDVVYAGSESTGAFKIVEGIHESLQVGNMRQKLLNKQAMVAVGSRSHASAETDACLEKCKQLVGAIDLISMGSSLKMCLVAEGKADFYPRLAPTSEWDTAAAHAVLRAAGGEIVDTQLHPLRYNQKESVLNPHFYAVGDLKFDWHALLV